MVYERVYEMPMCSYSAFYVKENLIKSNLGACVEPDFNNYNMLKAWKKEDPNFPFFDAHGTTYDVRDDSNWETLKSRLHERLRNSKNIILFLSSGTKESRALKEEIDYGINTLGLPIIVVYPDYKEKYEIAYQNKIREEIKSLWDKLPIFKDNMGKVPTVHVPFKKEIIEEALFYPNFTVQHKKNNCCSFAN